MANKEKKDAVKETVKKLAEIRYESRSALRDARIERLKSALVYK